MSGEELPGQGAADPFAGTTGTLASLTGAARRGGLDAPAALTALTAARRLAAELDRGELVLIEAARDSGATWSQIAAAIGTRNRQTAQKRHADLSRRYPRPPLGDTVQPGAPGRAGQDARENITARAGFKTPAVAEARDEAGRLRRAGIPVTCKDAGSPPHAAPGATSAAAGRKRPAALKITPGIIGEGRYELVKAPDHAETRAWHVLVEGQYAGLVRPTWRGERARPGWEAADNAGTALPAMGIGRVTSGGNARTRDAAAVSLLRSLLRQQENERRRKAAP